MPAMRWRLGAVGTAGYAPGMTRDSITLAQPAHRRPSNCGNRYALTEPYRQMRSGKRKPLADWIGSRGRCCKAAVRGTHG